MNSEEQNEIQNRLFSWHKKKNIKCPSCKSPLFHFDGRPYFSSAHIVNEIVVLHHSPCTSSIGNCGKDFSFACPVGVKVPIRLGDCKIKDANVYDAMTTTKCQKTIPKI